MSRVKGYYRSDGTYVKPHGRVYNKLHKRIRRELTIYASGTKRMKVHKGNQRGSGRVWGDIRIMKSAGSQNVRDRNRKAAHALSERRRRAKANRHHQRVSNMRVRRSKRKGTW